MLAIGVLNELNGLHQLNQQQWHIGFRVAAIFLYFVIALRLVQLVVLLRNG